MKKLFFIFAVLMSATVAGINCKTNFIYTETNSQVLQSQEKKDKELVEAAKSEDYEKVRQLLEQGANPDSFYQISTDIRQPVLGIAVDEKNVKIAQALLEKGANVNRNSYTLDKDSRENWVRLNFPRAVQNQDIQMMQLLAEYQADMDKDNTSTPLIHSAKNKEVFDFLLANGFDINTRDSFHGRTPLFEAVFNHDLELVKLILQYKPDLYAKNNPVGMFTCCEYTPLQLTKAMGVLDYATGGKDEKASLIYKEIATELKKAGAKK